MNAITFTADQIKRAGFAIRLLALVLALAVPFSAGAQQQHSLLGQTTPEPETDYLGMSNNFLTGLFGTSPEIVGRYLDAQAQTEIGIALWNGDYERAVGLSLDYTRDQAIGSIPVVGQLYAMGQLGQQLGDAAWITYGPGEFNKIYRTYFSEFQASELAQPPDDFVKAMISQGSATVLFAWIDRQTGKANSDDEKIQIIWDMIKEKRNFQILCDRYGLPPGTCTQPQLMALEMQEAAVIAQAARLLEQDRQEQKRLWLEEKARKAKEWEQQQQKDRAAFEAFLCDVWLDRVVDEKGHALPRPSDADVERLCGEAPKHADDPGAGNPDANDRVADDLPPATPADGQSGAVAWSVTTARNGDETVYSVTLTNVSGGTVTALALDVSAAGRFASGGIAAGSGRAADLGPGQSRVHKIITFGDIKGIVGTLSSGGQVLGTFARMADVGDDDAVDPVADADTGAQARDDTPAWGNRTRHPCNELRDARKTSAAAFANGATSVYSDEPTLSRICATAGDGWITQACFDYHECLADNHWREAQDQICEPAKRQCDASNQQ